MNIFQNTEIAFSHLSDNQIKKSYYLFKTIQHPHITKIGNSLLNFSIKVHIPFMRNLIKNTIFEHFCGGETREESLPIIKELYSRKVYSILDYSVEGKEEEKVFDDTCEEIVSIIKFSQHNDAMPFAVFKPTGFGRFSLYEKVNKKEDLTETETQEWNKILQRFEKVANAAYDAGIELMVDAEESWIQDAIDEIVENLMRKYNQKRCVIFNTLQMYRHDRLQYLKNQYEKAEKEDYYLGFKVVRGAYMEKERERAQKMNYPSPIQKTKIDTDKDYDAAIDFITDNHHRIMLYAGTHNENSCTLLMSKFQYKNLPKNDSKIWFGQLYGMSDNLSFNLADKGYNVAKYLPYGPIEEVIPYLTRRATENTSVAGQTGRELQLLSQEIKRRKLS